MLFTVATVLDCGEVETLFITLLIVLFCVLVGVVVEELVDEVEGVTIGGTAAPGIVCKLILPPPSIGGVLITTLSPTVNIPVPMPPVVSSRPLTIIEFAT